MFSDRHAFQGNFEVAENNCVEFTEGFKYTYAFLCFRRFLLNRDDQVLSRLPLTPSLYQGEGEKCGPINTGIFVPD